MGDVKERFCTRGRWVRNGLHRAVTQPRTARVHLHNALRSMAWIFGWSCVETAVGLDGLRESLTARDVPRFCDYRVVQQNASRVGGGLHITPRQPLLLTVPGPHAPLCLPLRGTASSSGQEREPCPKRDRVPRLLLPAAGPRERREGRGGAGPCGRGPRGRTEERARRAERGGASPPRAQVRRGARMGGNSGWGRVARSGSTQLAPLEGKVLGLRRRLSLHGVGHEIAVVAIHPLPA